jgi:fumarate reductase subunit D
MNVRTRNVPAAYRFAVAARAVAAVIVVAGILFIGYTAPVGSVMASDRSAEALAYGNGPTGYFPDMFSLEGAEDYAHVEAF